MSEKIAVEVAESEFQRFADEWCLDDDTASMEEEDRQSFDGLRRRLVRSIVDGSLVVNGAEDGTTLTYQLERSEFESLAEITFKVPKGDAVLSWDKFKDRQSIHKLNAFMGAMVNQNPMIFSRMDARDLKVCQAVAQLFLGS